MMAIRAAHGSTQISLLSTERSHVTLPNLAIALKKDLNVSTNSMNDISLLTSLIAHAHTQIVGGKTAIIELGFGRHPT